MKARVVGTLSLGVLAGLSLSARQALAFTGTVHDRMVEEAVQLMGAADDAPPPAPAGVDAALWNQYVALLVSSTQSLSSLRSNLHVDGPASGCGYAPTDNLATIGDVRIRDLEYTPIRTSETGHCTLNRKVGTQPADKLLAKILGYHAMVVDDQKDDSAIQIRLTNVLILQGVDTAGSIITEASLGAALLPLSILYCIGSGFSDCDPVHTAGNLAIEYNPWETIYGAIPLSFGDYDFDLGAGMWHYMDLDSQTNFHNAPRGLWFPGAGKDGIPGASDIAAMTSADLLGASLKALPNITSARVAQGIDRYGQYDTTPRKSRTQWQSSTIGHLEFSPVQNLAQFGWDQFRVHQFSDSHWLGWPLHALGDVCVPQHIHGTTGHGHQPWEYGAELAIDVIFPPAATPSGLATTQAGRIYLEGFNWWKTVRGHQNLAEVSLRDFAVEVAKRTNSFTLNADWVWDDVASVAMLADVGPSRSAAIQLFANHAPDMMPVLEQGVGAMIAILAEAGRFAVDPGPEMDTSCPSGTVFNSSSTSALGTGCTSLCLTGGNACSSNANCCSDYEFSCKGGTCLPASVCVARDDACASTSDCCSGLACKSGKCADPCIGGCESDADCCPGSSCGDGRCVMLAPQP